MKYWKQLENALYGEEAVNLCDIKCPDCGEKKLKMAFVTDEVRVDIRCLNCGYIAMDYGVEKKPNIVGILETISTK